MGLPLKKQNSSVSYINSEPAEVAPECPAHITGRAKEEWDRISALLAKYKLITELDTAALALYCASYGRWQDAEARIKEDEEDGKESLATIAPNGFPMRSTFLAIANDAMSDCFKYMQQFSLSPAIRAKLKPAGKEKKACAKGQEYFK